MSPKKFSWGIWVALAITLAAVWFAPRQEEEIALAPRAQNTAPPVRHVQRDATPDKPVRVLEIRARQAEEDEDSLFLATDWGYRAPQIPQEEERQPTVKARSAPPLPFKFIGRYMENGQNRVFMQDNDKIWVVGVGDTLASVYKIEKIDDHAIALRYLPLGEEQILEVEKVP